MEGTRGDGGDVVLVEVQVFQLPQLLQRTRWNLADDQSQNTSIFLSDPGIPDPIYGSRSLEVSE